MQNDIYGIIVWTGDIRSGGASMGNTAEVGEIATPGLNMKDKLVAAGLGFGATALAGTVVAFVDYKLRERSPKLNLEIGGLNEAQFDALTAAVPSIQEARAQAQKGGETEA